MSTNQYGYGRGKEEKVAKSLRRYGASVEMSPGSKGAADLKVKFKTGTQWNVQVKATRVGKAATPSPQDLGRLKQGATKVNATPVVASVTPQGIEYKSARSGRTLKVPKKTK